MAAPPPFRQQLPPSDTDERSPRLRRSLRTCVAGIATLASSASAQHSIRIEEFLSTEWRIAGMIYPTLPADGYPVAFDPDGSARTEHVAFVATWALANDTLRLSGPLGEVFRFAWVPDRRVFRACSGTVPPLLLFPRGFSLNAVLSIGCPDSHPDGAHPEAAVTCRLEVVPKESRVGETIEFRYEIMGADGQLVSGRYFHNNEEMFGASLQLADQSGSVYRFLRSTWVGQRAELDPDDGASVPRRYRFTFPYANRTDLSRLVTLDAWSRVWAAETDSAAVAMRTATFASGLQAIAPGTYIVTADLPSEMFRVRSATGGSRSGIRCAPAEFTVRP